VTIARRVAVALVGVLVLSVAVEAGGRAVIERIAVDRLRGAGLAGGIEVVVGEAWWNPSVVPTLFGADLDRVEVRLREANVLAVPVSSVDYVLHGLDVAVSLRDRTIGASSLESGSVSVTVDPSAIGGPLGVEATIEHGVLRLGDEQVRAGMRMKGNDLIVTSSYFGSDGGGGSTSIRIVDRNTLPCSPTLRISGAMVELRCSGDRLPGILGSPLGPRPDDEPLRGPAPPELVPPASIQLRPTTTIRAGASTGVGD
jgi:hypothetical protein